MCLYSTSCFSKKYSKELKTLIYKSLRIALTGSEHGCDVVDIMYMLGRKETMKRLERCLAVCINSEVFETDKKRKLMQGNVYDFI